MHPSLSQPAQLPNTQSQHWRYTLPDTRTEYKHSGNQRSTVRSASQASPSSAALAPEVKVPQLMFATQRSKAWSYKEMLLGGRNAALIPKLKSTGKTAILLCLTKAKLGKSYHFYSGKSNRPCTQALEFYCQRARKQQYSWAALRLSAPGPVSMVPGP